MLLKGTCVVVVCSLACLVSFGTGVEALRRRKDKTVAASLTATQTATAEIQTMVTSVKVEAETKIGRTFNRFNAVSFRSQVVTGTEYFVKVHVGGASYVHLKINKSVSGQVALVSYQTGVSRMAEIVSF